MSDIVSLEQDEEKLERYQADSLIGQLGVVQLHLEDIYSGKEVALCLDCIQNKHLLIIKTLANECVGICRIGPLWEEIAEWATDFNENKVNSQYLGKGNKETLELRNQARTFRKKLGEILRIHNKANSLGDEKMIEKRGVEPPDFEEVAGLDNPGKTEEMKQATKKKSSWPWLVAIGGAGILYYFHGKKKAVEALQRAEEEPQGEESKKPVLGGGEETELGVSADDRLRAMGEDPEKGSTPQARENWKEL